MTLTVDIPDEVVQALDAGFGPLGRAALEALAAEAYGKDVLSLEQVRQMLKLDSRWDAQEVLSSHGVWPGQTSEEILHDARTSEKFRASHP